MDKLVKALKQMVIEMILNDQTKVKIIAHLNKKINLPLISEETEAMLMDGLYEAMQEAIADAINE